MNQNQMRKTQNIFNVMETVFKYLFLTLTMLSFNSLTAHSPIVSVFSYLTAILGTVLVLNRAVHFKNYIKFYGIGILVCFVISYGVSSLINMEFGLMGNIQSMVWMVFQYGLLYAMDVNSPVEKDKKSYFHLVNYFLIYVALLNLISVIMLLTGYGHSFLTSFNGNIVGYVWGRLWGAYSDPNVGAVLCIAAMVISVIYAIKTTKIWLRVLHILNILLAFMYLCFSDSRTGIVCLAITVFIFAFLLLRLSDKLKMKNALKQVVCLLLAAGIMATSLLAIPVVKKSYNMTVKAIYESNREQENPSTSEEEDPSKGPNVIERTGNELDEDISNRRFDLWGSGIEIWKNAPVFGTAFRTLQPFADKNNPDTYMVNNDTGNKFNSTHNSLIDILVSQGVVGVLIFLAFVVMIAVLVCKKMIFTKKSTYSTLDNIMMLALLINFAVSAVFIPELIYINSVATTMFWITLGILVKDLKYREEK